MLLKLLLHLTTELFNIANVLPLQLACLTKPVHTAKLSLSLCF